MKDLRNLLAVVVLGLLCLGYGASQASALNGAAAEYAVKVDTAPIKWLALSILILCIVLSFIRDKEADGK